MELKNPLVIKIHRGYLIKKHVIKTYSGGINRRINIAAKLLHNNKILFLDGPTVGVNLHI